MPLVGTSHARGLEIQFEKTWKRSLLAFSVSGARLGLQQVASKHHLLYFQTKTSPSRSVNLFFVLKIDFVARKEFLVDSNIDVFVYKAQDWTNALNIDSLVNEKFLLTPNVGARQTQALQIAMAELRENLFETLYQCRPG